jgi:hypothetical protein
MIPAVISITQSQYIGMRISESHGRRVAAARRICIRLAIVCRSSGRNWLLAAPWAEFLMISLSDIPQTAASRVCYPTL